MGEVGRPETPINWKVAEDLIISGCPGTEVAAYFGIHADTLYRRAQSEKGMLYTDYAANFKQKGEAMLRAKQYAKALGTTKSGDNVMLVWLGKNRLGQKESAQDISIDKETVTHFNALMKQLEVLQDSKSDLNNAENNINTESKS